jgi:hypothetical protein
MPIAAAADHPSNGESPGRTVLASIGSDAHRRSPPPTPCTQRSATSTLMVLATPQPIEASPNNASPAISARIASSRLANGMIPTAVTISARL